MGNHNAAHVELHSPKHVDEPEDVLLIGDAQIPPDLVFLNVAGADRHDNLHILPQLLEHADFAVRLEAGQDPGGVVVVKELAAEL